MEVFYEELTLGVENSEQLNSMLWAMDSRKLLTFIYILKAMIKTLKNYVRGNINKITAILIAIIQLFEPREGESSHAMEEENN